MSREAFESFMRSQHENISLDRIGTGEYREWFVWRTWQAWRVATNAALEEAAEVCEARKIITPEWQLDQHYNQAATHCAAAIRALKEKR